jgi:hypothetical protein
MRDHNIPPARGHRLPKEVSGVSKKAAPATWIDRNANAVLGEGLRRLALMRESKADQAARKMSRGEPRSPARKTRATAFKRLFEAFGFTGHGLLQVRSGVP